jgi:hypothetical protein
LLVMAKTPGLDREGIRLREVPLDVGLANAFADARRRIDDPILEKERGTLDERLSDAVADAPAATGDQGDFAAVSTLSMLCHVHPLLS